MKTKTTAAPLRITMIDWHGHVSGKDFPATVRGLFAAYWHLSVVRNNFEGRVKAEALAGMYLMVGNAKVVEKELDAIFGPQRPADAFVADDMAVAKIKELIKAHKESRNTVKL